MHSIALHCVRGLYQVWLASQRVSCQEQLLMYTKQVLFTKANVSSPGVALPLSAALNDAN